MGGSHASGGLTIVRVADQPAVDLDIRGLTPSAKGETYVLWFSGSGGGACRSPSRRSAPTAASPAGRRSRAAATSLLPSFQTVDSDPARQRDTAAAVQQAAQAGTLASGRAPACLRGSRPSRWQQLAGVHDPGRVEALLDGAQRVEADSPTSARM